MGNSVLAQLAAHAPVMTTVSLPRGRHRLHAMPTSTGYEIRTHSSYDWNGRKRGQTPFTVLQHTVSGTGNLLYERRRYRLSAGDTTPWWRTAASIGSYMIDGLWIWQPVRMNNAHYWFTLTLRYLRRSRVGVAQPGAWRAAPAPGLPASARTAGTISPAR